MNKITHVTHSLIRNLPTGTILKLKRYHRSSKIAMVLRNVMHTGKPQDIVSGATWCPLDALNPEEILEIWQPNVNASYLNRGLNTDDCTLRYKRNTEVEDKITALKEKAQEVSDVIKELEKSL